MALCWCEAHLVCRLVLGPPRGLGLASKVARAEVPVLRQGVVRQRHVTPSSQHIPHRLLEVQPSVAKERVAEEQTHFGNGQGGDLEEIIYVFLFL